MKIIFKMTEEVNISKWNKSKHKVFFLLSSLVSQCSLVTV